MRSAEIVRKTNETDIKLSLNIDGEGRSEIKSGSAFLDHMLTLFAKHGRFDLTVSCVGDIDVDCHHTTEDIGICLGQAFREALGDKRGIVRYGHAYVPLDESLSRAVLDCSGRPGLTFVCSFTRENVGGMDTELVREFFQGFVNSAGVTLHLDNLRGENSHHQAESLFKAFGRALRMAVAFDERAAGTVPSTKGVL